jgi:uncharacterized protein YraI
MRLKMMKALPALLAGSLVAVLALPDEAVAQSRAVVTTDLNMRAGPGTQFPVVNVLAGGRTVTVHGCVRNLTWCDVTTRSDRGWVSARYLAEERRGRPIVDLGPSFGLPVISFQFDYWDRHYSGRPFYRERDRWRRDWDGPRRSRDADRRDWGRVDEPDRRRDAERDRRGEWDAGRDDGRGDWDRDRRGDRVAPEATGSTVIELRSRSVEEEPRIEMRREGREWRRSDEGGARRWDGPPGHRDGHPGRGRGPRD